jgi:DNA-binding CsgD family transcriptional regulator
MELAGADSAMILLPGDVPRWRAVHRPPGTSGAGRAEPIGHDEATERLLRTDSADGHDAIRWARDDLASRATLAQGATAPLRHETPGIRVRTATGSVAAACVYRDASSGPSDHQIGAALRAIAPAFQAGVERWLGVIASRTDVTGMLDSLADPALLFDADGTLIHTNSAADARLAAPDVARLRDDAQRVAWALGALARRQQPVTGSRSGTGGTRDVHSVRTIHLGGTVYRLRGSIVGEHILGTRPAVLVTVTAAAAEPLTDDALRAGYGLTAREIQVARLIAQGLSNSEIAERIGIRFFTARNHVERALSKLGVASRHRVGPLLRNEVPDARATGRASAA